MRVLTVVFLMILSLTGSSAWAQAERAFSNPGNRIVSLDQDRRGNSLVMRMERASAAPPPIFKYLPGADGDTVLTADFVGLAWNFPPQIIRLISSEKGLRPSSYTGIKEVRVSQFVESPAVLRISFVARDPKVLKAVAIGAAPGMLKVSWPSAVASASPAPTSLASAPEVVRNVSREEPKVAPRKTAPPAEPVAAESPKTEVAESRPAHQRLPRFLSDTTSDAPVKTAPCASTNVGEAGTMVEPDGAQEAEEVPPTISLVPCDSLGSDTKMEIFRVELPQGKEIKFKGFRLHDPERYVVDIPNCRSLGNAEVPDVSASNLVSAVRVGVPSEAEGTGRLVLQLADNGVNVADSFVPGSNFFTITLGKGLMLGSASRASVSGAAGEKFSEKFNSPDIVPGPIVVPRAPSETVVVLDAGHGGTDAGAVRSEIQEKDITLSIIMKLKKILEAKGARIVLTRHDDTFVSLEDRVKITNAVGPNLFLSVHINSLEGTSSIYGIETYFQTDLSRPLAERVHASLVAGLQAPDRNIRRARFYVINHTPVPAILAEVGYITSKAERERLINSDYQQKVASALARGVMLYLQDSGVSAGQLANSAASRGAH